MIKFIITIIRIAVVKKASLHNNTMIDIFTKKFMEELLKKPPGVIKTKGKRTGTCARPENPNMYDMVHMFKNITDTSELKSIIEDLPEDIILILITMIEKYVIFRVSAIRLETDAYISYKKSVSDFGTFLYRSIRTKIKTKITTKTTTKITTNETYVLLFVVLYLIISETDKLLLAKEGFEDDTIYVQSYVLKGLWKKKSLICRILPHFNNTLVVDGSFLNRFVCNNDKQFSKIRIALQEMIIKKGVEVPNHDLFRHMWSFRKYETLTMDEFLFTLNSSVIYDILHNKRNGRYEISCRDSDLHGQYELLCSRISYFLLKYPECLSIIISELSRYMLAFFTLIYLQYPRKKKETTIPFQYLNDEVKNMLFREFLEIDLTFLLESIRMFWNDCDKKIINGSRLVKSYICKEYLTQKSKWNHNFMRTYLKLYTTRLSQKRDGDDGFVLLLKSTFYENSTGHRSLYEKCKHEEGNIRIVIDQENKFNLIRFKHIKILGLSTYNINQKCSSSSSKYHKLNLI